MAVENFNRKIIISDSISSSIAREIIQRIIEINDYDDNRDSKEKDYNVKPIQLFINSPGGSVYDGLGIIDVMKYSKAPIHTYCFGRCMSMGLAIYLAGEKRYSGEFSTFMYHDVSGGVFGTSEQIKRSSSEMERLVTLIDNFVLDRTTNILQTTLSECRTKVDNWFIDAKEAKKLGIVHEIL